MQSQELIPQALYTHNCLIFLCSHPYPFLEVIVEILILLQMLNRTILIVVRLFIFHREKTDAILNKKHNAVFLCPKNAGLQQAME